MRQLYTVYNNELFHYGKIGMKWGKRKSVIQDGVQSGKRKKTPKEHVSTGTKVAGKALSLIGHNAVRMYRLNQAQKIMNGDY